MTANPGVTLGTESGRGGEPTSLRLILTLSLAGLLSGMIIVSVYEATLPTITAYQARMLREAVFRVLPDVTQAQRLVWQGSELVAKDKEGKGEEAIFGGYDAGGHLVGYAIPSDGPGFQDTIKLLYGYLPDSRKIVGMEVLDSRETPGLGDKIYKDAAFVGEFKDLSIDPEIHAVKRGTGGAPNEVDAITGATISSKAVVRIINEGNARWLPRLAASSPPSLASDGQPPGSTEETAAPSRDTGPELSPSHEPEPPTGARPLETGD